MFSTATPKVIQTTPDSKIHLHGSVTLTCHLSAPNISPLKTFWWVPNHPLPLFSGQQTNVSGIVSIDQIVTSNDTVQSTLRLENFNTNLSGQYLCGSENAGGVQSPMGSTTLQLLPNDTGSICCALSSSHNYYWKILNGWKRKSFPLKESL